MADVINFIEAKRQRLRKLRVAAFFVFSRKILFKSFHERVEKPKNTMAQQQQERNHDDGRDGN